ncbi:serine and arginine rich splicing factor 7a isoform X2 [Simochromis diagramma]|uniref:serine and arginine rich splicing factor 7a isoform X2 n=1 Tax=Simochromis diagramma TaxID=43689 RepID=UPI001A7E5BF7|nr:serine and arginine rich splicing factor 7a isoform X2 [Simochromis diagramma]
MQKMLSKAWTERSSVVPVFVWRCQQASPERAVGGQAVASSTPTIGVTSAGTGVTTPMTATALASEAVAAGLALDRDPAPDQGPAGAATALAPAPAAAAGADADRHPIPDAGAGLDPLPAQSPGLQPEVVPGLVLGPVLLPEGALCPDPGHVLSLLTTRGTVVPVRQLQTEALLQQTTERRRLFDPPPFPPPLSLRQTLNPCTLSAFTPWQQLLFFLVVFEFVCLVPVSCGFSPQGCSLCASLFEM